MGSRVAVMCLVLVSCTIDDELVICGDLACPPGSVCTVLGCATPDQVAACSGLEDTEPCSTPEVGTGACLGGVCLQAVCGDGLQVGTEVCDDANQRSGDGCSADCLSAETCGNDYIDPLAGEECDDNRALSRDGCTAQCTLEVDVWLERTPTPAAGRQELGIAYDERRGRVVVFGGAPAPGERDLTLEWDGNTWHKRAMRTTPPRRVKPMMAYDAARGEVVMFGGMGAIALGDTWVFDGIDWIQRTPTTSPSMRSGAAMAYDRLRQRVVMFGGANTNETWLWDGTTWSLATPQTSPLAAASIAAWDESSQRVLLYQPASGATFAWTGTTWTDLAPVATPPTSMTLAVAGEDGTTVRITGATGSGFMDTWQWTGTTWTPVSSGTQPAERGLGGLAFDRNRNRIVFASGNVALLVTEWTGTDWVQPTAVVTPGAKCAVAMAYLATTGTSFMFGDLFNNTLFEWDGDAFVGHALNPAPSARWFVALIATRSKILLHGGLAFGITGLPDTWEFDGTSWTQRTPVHSPGNALGHALAYDAGRDRVVMFGGGSNLAARSNTTWEWDGVDWLQQSPAHSPPGRTQPAMTYDPVRGKTVLFGGLGTGLLADTWEWDGVDWVEVTSPGPVARSDMSMVFDAARGRSVLFGGRDNAGNAYDDTWEWDGASWARRIAAVTPIARGCHAMTYDPIRGQIVVFGGSDGQNFGDVWVHERRSQALPPDACLEVDTDGDGLTGCADPDCWGRCTPECPPRTTCAPNAPRCGDNVCSTIENDRVCPADCPP